MILTRAHELTNTQLYDIDKLHQACKQADGNMLPIYKHLISKRHPLACNVLCYEDEILLGYLRTYFFYTDACEVALMVTPTHRRQGIASNLLREILPVVENEGIVSLIFSIASKQYDDWLTNMHFTYRNSECQMQYDRNQPITTHPKPATIRRAGLDDVPILCEIDSICFPNKKTDQEALFQSLLYTPDCDLFVLTQDEEVLGKAHIFTEPDRVRLTDIGILPKARGQGLGASLVKHCINQALIRNKTKIFLDVETINERAIKLYTGLGFIITNSHDYWVSPKDASQYGLSKLIDHR